ncbi:LLM class flavin-dependent oxidoreductase, partial [Kitasatospora herbaricolor]|uniref:LLM class flavin-dependent oxidoreductase n=1 Tax=Kitasatospora herbaricolor TaxID=68217 RepID=UPI0036D89D4A
MTGSLNLAVALDGAGWHPYAWRDARLRPSTLFRPGYWTDQVRRAEQAGIDFVTFEDALALQSSVPPTEPRLDHVRGRLDAVQIASFVAPTTSTIGLVPTTSVIETEPFHVSTQIATLDFVSSGRAGWRVQAVRPGEQANFGRRTEPPISFELYQTPEGQELVARAFAETAEVVSVVRALWDSWEDDAVIRDVATGRFLDRDKLHHVHFEGSTFSVAGPSITPRPPQGQPLVTVLAHAAIPYRLAASSADVVFVTPHSIQDVRRIVDEVRAIERETRTDDPPLRVFADLVVVVDETTEPASARLREWNERDGADYRSDALVVAASADELADLIGEWQGAGIQGVRLR